MQDFPGTLIFVSHDREFIHNVATSVLSLENGRAAYFPCDYETYRWRLAQRMAEIEASAVTATAVVDTAKEDRVAQREAAKQLKRKRQRAERKAEELQAKLEVQETRIAEIETKMAEPSFFHDFAASQPLVDEHEQLKATVEAGYEELEQALEAIEAIDE
jgi:ATP-binding cassette subfamily F protein 3